MGNVDAWMVVLAGLAPTVAVGGVGFLLKQWIGGIVKKNEEQDHRIEKLEDDSVKKEDWLREAGITRQSLQRIGDDIAELKGQGQAAVDIGSRIVTAIDRATDIGNRVVTALERKREGE